MDRKELEKMVIGTVKSNSALYSDDIKWIETTIYDLTKMKEMWRRKAIA